ncbi:MAG: DJ-1/PfpI family protein, partial [Alphaproteobacteria bacterium]
MAGPLEVFAITSECVSYMRADIDTPCYEIEVISPAGGPVVTSAGIAVETAAADVADVDTFLIPGAARANLPLADATLIEFVRAQAQSARRVGSIGSAAFILAQTGLLAGRRATAHWAYVDEI